MMAAFGAAAATRLSAGPDPLESAAGAGALPFRDPGSVHVTLTCDDLGVDDNLGPHNLGPHTILGENAHGADMDRCGPKWVSGGG